MQSEAVADTCQNLIAGQVILIIAIAIFHAAIDCLAELILRTNAHANPIHIAILGLGRIALSDLAVDIADLGIKVQIGRCGHCYPPARIKIASQF
jgi:hypothetical protein